MLSTLCLLTQLALGQAPPASDSEPPGEELPITKPPAILQYVEAPYPDAAREAAVEGTVLLLIEIGVDGRVTTAEVLEGAGYGFDEAALEAVQAMSFSPAETEAGPVPVVLEFAYGFTLEAEEVEAPEAPINLEGYVLEMGTRAPIAGAKVVVAEASLEATTDDDGFFALRGVPSGYAEVRVLHPGHATVSTFVQVEDDEVSTWKFWMRADSYRSNEAVGLYQREREEVTRRTITMEEARRIPGTFGDPIKVVQTLPGAARTPFGTGFLVIRGSDPEDSGVYVDGIRIPIIYHLTGNTSVISPDLIESVDYLPGSYGAQYGRSMGGVVDVKTRTELEDSKLVWGTDILDSQVYWEGKLGKNGQHGLAVAARRSYIDLLLPLVLPDQFTIKPRYWDYQVKWIPKLPGEQELSVFVYGFEDVLAVATPADVAQGSDRDTQGDLRTQFATQRVIARYARPLSRHLALEVTPSLGVDYGNFGLGNEFRLDNTNWITEVRLELPWTPSEAVEIRPGVDLIGGLWRFDFAAPFSVQDLDDPLAEREPVGFGGKGSAWGPDVYVKSLVRPLAERDRWLISAGLRASGLHFTYGGDIVAEGGGRPWSRLALDPRLSTRLQLFEGATLKAATGLYHQPPQPFEAVGVGTDVTLGFERAWTSSLGFEHQVSPAINWDIDLFYKDLSDLVVFDDRGFVGIGSEAFVNRGRGRAYGLELMARHDPVGRFFGWVSYTLSRAERKDRPRDDWTFFDFDQTHIFSAQGGYDLPYDLGVSAQIQYVTGTPTSLLDTGVYDIDSDTYTGLQLGPRNSVRQPGYFQTSLRVDKLWTFKKWQLETYVDLLQLLRGVNPEFTTYAYDYSEYAYVRGLPFIPNIGIEARFWP